MLHFLNKYRAQPQNTEYQLGVLRQYPPRPTQNMPQLPSCPEVGKFLRICMVTPSYEQSSYLEQAVSSVLDQQYPHLSYGVQDGGSRDGSSLILKRYENKLSFTESLPDGGQSDALIKGFDKLNPQSQDIMAWLNSDDILLPGVLSGVNRFFLTHPEVDVIYGHRLIIDSGGAEIGRWYLPEFDPEVLKWVDFIPQETLFFRASAYQKAGGLSPDFHFAMDWDLLLRFQQSGCHFQRLPYFMGCFRLHEEQKTQVALHSIGEEEMTRLRKRSLGSRFTPAAFEPRFWRQVRKSRIVAKRAVFGDKA
jgi:glycosyltransferase involved in cell wall biosynthesis